MGINWKAMTLLSILAALVIIVHSVEEDFEPDYRDLRPRRMETVTPGYDQPWRMLEMEPLRAKQSTQPDWDVTHQEEPPKRRRSVRKRKRRPLISSEDDLIPQERHVYAHDQYLPYQNEHFTSEPPVIRRRRKQFDTRQPERLNSWTDETIDADRPLIRRRGYKRKRPTTEAPWPEFSEFNERDNDNTEENDETYKKPTESIKNDDSRSYDTREVYLQNDDTVVKTDSAERNTNKYVAKETSNIGEFINDPVADDTDNSSYKKDTIDQSSSEVSLENEPPSEDIINTQEKINEKSLSTPNDVHKSKSNGTINPQTLKEILKKSNGRSLSEILQQHNLSLVDLLHGKEKAISILKMIETQENDSGIVKSQSNVYNKLSIEKEEASKENKRHQNRNYNPLPKESLRNSVIVQNTANVPSITSTKKPTNKSQYKQTIESVREYTTSRPSQFIVAEKNKNDAEIPKTLSNLKSNMEETITTTTKSPLRHRYPVDVRRKIRMRPMNNTSYKSQLSRDLIALTSRRYQLSRNSSRLREWRDMVPTMIKVNRKEQKINNEKEVAINVITTTIIPEETTVQQSYEKNKASIVPDVTDTDPMSTTITETTSIEPSTETIFTIDMTETETIPTTTATSSTTTTTTTTSTTTVTPTTSSTTEKPLENITSRSDIKSSDLRRQAFNYRLKRKRLKQKSTTTEPTQDYAMKDIFGMANLVSASEFIAKIQPRTTSNDEEQDFTTLEDFMTTEPSTKPQIKIKSTKAPKNKYSTTNTNIPIEDMEETAKIEIEEILNDTRTSARLSKILMERNMTINELVEHRERGSSHIHLADIFHNASKEPNPPEPFLSKSLIEPISKETYPLRALLEANLHDPTAKATTIDPNITLLYNLNIPVVMDFGNNVNENAENLGIISLFNNFTKNIKLDVHTKEGKEQPLISSSVTTEDNVNHDNDGVSRESRILNIDKDLITWKEIIAIMHRGQTNKKGEVVELTTREISQSHEPTSKKIVLDDDMDGDDGLIVLNDLQHGKDFNNLHSSTSDEKLEVHTREKTELPQIYGVSNKTSNTAKSVTIATASIIGLAMVLFLLTYIGFRWKQQRSFFQDKQSLRTSKIPSPVFENRKGHKHNSSTRSKSPMISSSNIYTVDTIDNRNGTESPEYMWDTIRKPFQ